MLVIDDVARHRAAVIAQLAKRYFPDAEVLIDELLHQNKERKKRQAALDTLAHQLKEQSKCMAQLLQQNDAKGAAKLRADIVVLKNSHKALLQDLKACQAAMQKIGMQLPNLPDARVPQGKGAAANQVVKTWGEAAGVQGAQPHWDVVDKYGLVDFERGNTITGAGFPVYKGKGARLQRALINFFLDEARKAGYEEVQPPVIVNKEAAFGTGQFPDKEGMMYALQQEDLYLIPTAEVPLTNLYKGALLAPKILPIRHVAHTLCFRREAGSWGREVRGLNRLHQFDKIELVEIHLPETSQAALEQMCSYVGGLLEKLGLPYRVLRLCSGELGFTAAMTYDIEVWAAGQQQWLEVSSLTLFNTFQACRMGLRYRAQGKNPLCHTINGSALALPRVLVALLENYQVEAGVQIPDVLQAYTGFERIP